MYDEDKHYEEKSTVAFIESGVEIVVTQSWED
jgi:hypothetical protein